MLESVFDEKVSILVWREEERKKFVVGGRERESAADIIGRSEGHVSVYDCDWLVTQKTRDKSLAGGIKVFYRTGRTMGLCEIVAAVEVEVLADPSGSYHTCAGTVSSGRPHDARQNSLSSAGIFEESIEPGSLFPSIQQTEQVEDNSKKRFRPCFMNSPSRIAWLISSSVLRCLLSISPHRVSLKSSLRKHPKAYFRTICAYDHGSRTCKFD